MDFALGGELTFGLNPGGLTPKALTFTQGGTMLECTLMALRLPLLLFAPRGNKPNWWNW